MAAGVTAVAVMGGITDMSYERDADRMTRGVGAIAALDHVAPGRQARRIVRDEVTRRRDRAMARIVASPSDLGRAAVIDHRTGKPVAVDAPPAPRRQTLTETLQQTLIASNARRAAAGVHEGGATDLRSIAERLKGGGIASGTTRPPPPPGAAAAPGASPVRASGGGGGGGGGGVMTTGGTGVPTPIVPAPPPDLPDVGPAPASPMLRNVLIIGGAAAAAYLFFRHRSQTP